MVSLATFNGLPQLPSLESLGLLKRDTSSLPKKMFECTPISSKVTLVKQPMHDVVRYSNVANQGSVRSTAPGLKRERPPSQTKVKLAKTGKVSFLDTHFLGMLSLCYALTLALMFCVYHFHTQSHFWAYLFSQSCFSYFHTASLKRFFVLITLL